MPLHDGINQIRYERYFTRNYVLNTHNDDRPWNITHDKYFIKKDIMKTFK
jgi:hypothetical protein